MPKEFVSKKLRQIAVLLEELEMFLNVSYLEFSKNKEKIRSSERNFQLLVEQASDINSHIILELGTPRTPDNYWESFREMERLGITSRQLSKDLMKSAKLRNILIHEYDFDQDNSIFYKSVKKYMDTYESYIVAIQKYLEKKKGIE